MELTNLALLELLQKQREQLQQQNEHLQEMLQAKEKKTGGQFPYVQEAH